MDKWPNLFIVGASKSATGTLYVHLSKVQGICMSTIKEPNYFSVKVHPGDVEQVIRDKKQYLSLFDIDKDDKIIGEASPEYLADSEAPKLIHQVSPNAKIIIILRDPVERAYSHYFTFVRQGRIKNSFHDELQLALKNKKNGIKSNFGLLESGLYSEQVKRYLEIFGPENVKILIFDEFIKNQKLTLQEVLDFLGINHSFDDFKVDQYNKFGMARSPLAQKILRNRKMKYMLEKILPQSIRKFGRDKILLKQENKPKMNEEDRTSLVNFYKADVEKLQNIIGQRLPWKNFYKMRIMSQNLVTCGIPIPDDAILRINLAWCDSLEELNSILKRCTKNSIFLDLPLGRIKPPSNNYSLEDLVPIIRSNKLIKYLAVSNVESASDLKKYIELLPKSIIIVPKIESPSAISNIDEITNVLKGEEKIVMLDHDDLFTNMKKNKEPESKFKEYIQNLINYCNKNNIILLRTIGVIFSDEEKRVSQYIK